MSEQPTESDDYKDEGRDDADPKTAAAPPPFDHVRITIAVDDTRLDKRITHTQLITTQNLAAARQPPDDLICDHIGVTGQSIAETWREEIDALADEPAGDDTGTDTDTDGESGSEPGPESETVSGGGEPDHSGS